MRLFSCTGGLQPVDNVANYAVCNAHHLASQLACSPRSCLAKLQFSHTESNMDASVHAHVCVSQSPVLSEWMTDINQLIYWWRWQAEFYRNTLLVFVVSLCVLCLTFFILPKALNTDDVRLQVGLRRLHVDELPDVVRVVFVATVLLVVSLRLHVLRQAFGFLAVFRQQNKEINLASQTPEPVRHIVGIKNVRTNSPLPPFSSSVFCLSSSISLGIFSLFSCSTSLLRCFRV